MGRQGRGCGWGELPGSPGASPSRVPALSVTLRSATAVTVSESVGDISGADDFDSPGFDRLDVLVGQCGAEVLEAPALIDGRVEFGQPGQHHLRPHPLLPAQRLVDIRQVIHHLVILGLVGRWFAGAAQLGDGGHGAGDHGGDHV